MHYNHATLHRELSHAGLTEPDREALVAFLRDNSAMNAVGGGSALQHSHIMGNDGKAYRMLFLLLKTFGASLS